MRKWMLLFCAIFLIRVFPADAAAFVPLSKYLEFARSSADWTWDHYDSLVTVWRQKLNPNNVFGYRPPSRLLEMATIYAFLYEKEGNKTYAKRARKVLLTYGDYRKAYPKAAVERRADYAKGVPALPDFFTTTRYIRAYDTLRRMNYLSASQQKKIKSIISGSVAYMLRTQEWGTMNRAMLRAEILAWAVRAVPDDPNIKQWKMWRRAIGFDNWGHWEIEDASLYNAIWLYALLGYSDAQNKRAELFRLPEMYYYAQYYLNLMSPDGMIPDFGDAYWNVNWPRYLVFFEASAKAYKNPNLKWAAETIANKFINFHQYSSTGLAYILLDCYRYGTDAVKPKPPKALSEEVMDDIVGKKIVFRNGWEPNSTYMLLNYRDVGDGGLIFRNYLRDTIPIEEEKATHGHSDGNSIALLMKNGSVLLHDGGYRDYMPSGPYGDYRADYFHNRICVRQEKIFMGQKKGQYRYSVKNQAAVPGQPVLDLLHNSGAHRRVRTQKYDFLTFPDFDYSRTRLVDDKMGYEWDRVITYVKNPELFVVFDIVKARTAAYFTAANLWHTRKILSKGPHWYDTEYDSLRNISLSTNTHLFILFPKPHFRLESVESERRYWQKEFVISEVGSQHFELGQNIAFVTVLVPHPAKENPEKWIKKIKWVESKPAGRGLYVEIQDGNRKIMIGAKRDLRLEMFREWRRPKYTYKSGKIQYGQFATNGDYFFATKTKRQLALTVVNLTKAVYGNQILFQQAPGQFGLAFDGSPDSAGVAKVRYWRDKVLLSR
ncbi:hypothetical protein BMS3Abin05_00756 [bacterium BMS3Abin05]|nr:hypothetical protein BMS3Abin05_00756 [bacterium BMS3Abin05]GBE28601.1 hypothetical protein BMS3Bbin03_02549 [bacterium BMS3Bbin03]